MSALASRDRAGRIHVTLSNLDPNAARTVTLDVQGATLTEVTGRILTGATLDATTRSRVRRS